MKKRSLVSIAVGLFVLLGATGINAQNNGSVAEKKIEVAAETSMLIFDNANGKIGFGGRLTYNLNSHIALEAATYFFSLGCDYCSRHAGHMTEGLFGIKAGKRFNKWGIFAKARPGLLSSREGKFEFQVIGVQRTDPPSFSFPTVRFVPKRLTTFAADLGGVVEYYPTKRLITRVDVGSTIIHYGKRNITFPVFDPITGGLTTQQSTIPAQNRGTLQFSAGVGFRF